MGWLDSLLGVPNAPHQWGGGGETGTWRRGPMRDDAMGGVNFGERAIFRPNGTGSFAQLWQRMQNGYAPPEGPPPQMPPYAAPEPGPQFGGYRPPEQAPPRMPPNVPTPWTGGPQPLPPPMQPLRSLPPAKGVIRK